jgi:hypothetical protein
LDGTENVTPAMPAIARPLFVTCTAYILRAIVLLALLAEAYSFINPSSYSAAYSTLESHLDESLLSLILEALKEVLRFFFKILSFFLSVDCVLSVFGCTWGTVEANTPRQWGIVFYFKLLMQIFAFRCAIRRDFWVSRWFIWYGKVLDRVLDLLVEFAGVIRNRGVAE